ncbi:MAG: uroporphyrinogen decarboxylase family protein [Kiritimatiellota bacterium]|nr:uroporphyrinogen decarboxylase family protein [Kiritimatiellota bacterium]
MTSRERVIAALEYRRPDRLPRFSGGFSRGFIDSWRKIKKLPEDADIMDYYRIDLPGILSDLGGPFSLQESLREVGGTTCGRDSWGRVIEYPLVLETIISEKTDLDRLVFESPSLPGRHRRMEEISRQHEGRFATVTGVAGLFHACRCMRGEVPFLMDMAEDEPFCRSLIDRLSEFLTGLGEQALTSTRTWDTAIWVVDDFGSNTGPLFGPNLFERLFLEPYRKMFARWKSKGVRHIMLHYDVMSRKSFPIIDMYRAAGLTGVQGIYPAAELSLGTFRERYGKSLNVIGGMNNAHTLPFGSREEIERQAAEAVEFGRDGGLVVGPHSMEENVPVASYDWFIEALDNA